ncbi:Uncharacterised protein [Mycobacteroides abscessus subsp. abscessus]|nr:Uncharacterised protein [Mycobacteroides abscessus subsp. abscessus]
MGTVAETGRVRGIGQGAAGARDLDGADEPCPADIRGEGHAGVAGEHAPQPVRGEMHDPRHFGQPHRPGQHAG